MGIEYPGHNVGEDETEKIDAPQLFAPRTLPAEKLLSLTGNEPRQFLKWRCLLEETGYSRIEANTLLFIKWLNLRGKFNP